MDDSDCCVEVIIPDSPLVKLITDTPLVKIKDTWYSGLHVVLRHLSSAAKNHPMFVKDTAVQLLVDQWVSYCATDLCPNLFPAPKTEVVNRCLHHINVSLASSSFIVAKACSAADVLIYFLLQGYITDNMKMAIGSNPHVVRWMQLIEGHVIVYAFGKKGVEGLTRVEFVGLPAAVTPEL